MPVRFPLALLAALALVAATLPARPDTPTRYHQVRITASAERLAALQTEGLGLDHVQRGEGWVDAVLSDDQLALLRSSGVRHEVRIADLSAHYAANVAMGASDLRDLQRDMDDQYGIEGFEFGSMGGYYTFAEVLAELDSMRLLYPNLVTVRQSIGTSHEGRDLWMVKISDNPEVDEGEPEILYTGLHHAREPQSMATVIYFMYHLLENYGSDPEVTFVVNNRELYFVPVLNPDGYVYNEQTNPNGGGFWRKNRRNNGDGTWGVDLNRNYGYEWGYDNNGSSPSPSSETYRGPGPFSEPETQAVRDFCNGRDIRLAFNFHSYGDLLIFPWGFLPDFLTPDSTIYRDLSIDMTQFNNYTWGTGDATVGYLVNGDSDDWMYGEQTTKDKIFAFTPEVGPSFWPSASQIYPLAQENLYPNMVLAMGPLVITTEALDPNPPADLTAYSDYTTPTGIRLTWTDPDAFGNGDPLPSGDFTIQIERDQQLVASVNGGAEEYLDSGLNDGQSYSYEIYARVTASDSISTTISVIQTAGGARQPAAPAALAARLSDTPGELRFQWRNPAVNIDGSPMDDFAAIRLYEDGNLVATYARTAADTGRLDSARYTPPAGTHRYVITAVDNETPTFESDPSNLAYSPLSLPFTDTFTGGGEPNPAYWLNRNADINTLGVNPPSAPTVLNMDGMPDGGDQVTLLPVDLSGAQGQGYLLSFWYQPQGSGNAPETGDILAVDFLNDQGDWVEVRSWPGTGVVPFANAIIGVDSEDPGPGASFFHPAFQLRFRNIGTASTTSSFDNWLIDDVFFGLPTGQPAMSVTPAAVGDTLLAGAIDSSTIVIANGSATPSTLNYTVADDPAVDWLTPVPASGAVASGNSATVQLRLDAATLTPGTYSTEAVVAGNDPNLPEVRIPVTLVVEAAPDIAVTPAELSFTVTGGGQDSALLTITNSGAGDLHYTIAEEPLLRSGAAPRPAERRYPESWYGVETGKGEPDARRGPAGILGSGGPDAFGHRWIDSDEPGGPAFDWIDIRTSGTSVSLTDDDFVEVGLPFAFEFYGQAKTAVKISSNGYLTFGGDGTDFSNDAIPDPIDPNDIVAPFWDDLNPADGGTIHYLATATQLVVQYTDINHYSGGGEIGTYTFQVILKASGQIVFQYLTLSGVIDSQTIGIENSDASDGLEIAFNAAYLHDNLAIRIASDAPWLSVDRTAGTVAPGGTAEIMTRVNAAGLTDGLYQARLSVASNDVDAPVVAVPVELLVGSAPAIRLGASELDFDTVAVGGSATRELWVHNGGNADLVVSDMTVSDPDFSLPMTQMTVPAGDSAAVTVTFTPGTVGAYAAELTMACNDPRLDTAYVALTGIATAGTGIGDPSLLPTVFAVGDNYPNPFNPTTTIRYQLPEAAPVRLVIYDVLGRRVRTLLSEAKTPGYHQVIWDGRNDAGTPVGSGIYLYRFQAGDYVAVRKMTLLK